MFIADLCQHVLVYMHKCDSGVLEATESRYTGLFYQPLNWPIDKQGSGFQTGGKIQRRNNLLVNMQFY